MFWGSKVSTDSEKIEEILVRGVDRLVHEESLRTKLTSGERLRVKLGIDPTSTHLHVGYGVPLLKLKRFQELGHQVVFIVGDATAVVGDTSDKDSERPMLSRDTAVDNARSYFEQAAKVLDISKVEKRYNSEWLDKLTFSELGEIANLFSVADFIARDNIKRRLDAGKRVSLRETLYPLMQGYDSVAVRADIEIGGSDQWFNLLAGRTIQEHYGQKPQDIITNTLYPGLDGRKMSASWGNGINLTDTPEDMYGKTMSMNDELIVQSFEGFTDVPLSEIAHIEKEIEVGSLNPKDAKMKLAREIVTLYHGAETATRAERHFIEAFSKGGIPEDMNTVTTEKGAILAEVLTKEKIVSSKTEFRRLVEAGAITNLDTQEKISDPAYTVEEEMRLKIGKHRFVRIVFK